MLRVAAIAAASVLALLSRGDVFALAVVLGVAAWRPVPALALVVALGATAWRFGSTSLEALAGVQAVLGAAGALDPPRAAAASWLAAVAVLLSTPSPAGVGGMSGGSATSGAPNPGGGGHEEGVGGMSGGSATSGALNLLAPVGFGAATAVVVAGPAPGGELWVRVVATIVAAVTAFFLCRLVPARARDVIVAVAAVAALALVAGVAPPWDGAFDDEALASGAALAVAVGALSAVTAAAWAALGRRAP